MSRVIQCVISFLIWKLKILVAYDTQFLIGDRMRKDQLTSMKGNGIFLVGESWTVERISHNWATKAWRLRSDVVVLAGM